MKMDLGSLMELVTYRGSELGTFVDRKSLYPIPTRWDVLKYIKIYKYCTVQWHILVQYQHITEHTIAIICSDVKNEIRCSIQQRSQFQDQFQGQLQGCIQTGAETGGRGKINMVR